MIGKVFFDGKDTYTEYGLLLASKSISLPEVRTNMIDVPGRDGLLDASEVLTGEVTYKNRTIVLKLTGVDTWKYKNAKTTVTGTVPESGTLSLTLANERRPVVPTVEVSAAATLTFGGKDIAVAAGSHRSLDIRLAAGSNSLAVTAAAGTTVSVTYQEASL